MWLVQFLGVILLMTGPSSGTVCDAVCERANGWVDRLEGGVVVMVDELDDEFLCPQSCLPEAREGVYMRDGVPDLEETRRVAEEIRGLLKGK